MKNLFLIVSVFAFAFSSCVKTDDLEREDNTNKYVNDWIFDTMDTYYYWTDKLPTNSDKSLAPDAYFESLLYKYHAVSAPDGDRFSWIQKDYQELVSSLDGVSSNEIGFDYMLYRLGLGSENLVGQVTYTKKGTSAEAIGIKRGMLFDKVNGTALTMSNYKTLLTISASQVTFGFIEESAVGGITRGPDLTVHTLADYSENPIYLDSVYTYSGHQVGYLVYHFFAADGGTNDAAYDLELNRVFGKFKAANITDLVIDLRYNSGGLSTSAELLASQIVPNLDESNVYSYYEYNKFLNDYYKNKYGQNSLNAYFTKTVKNGNTVLAQVNNVGNHIGGKVVVLTGIYTASASEQVINGLKPYMDVILIGDTTYGKNVSSFSLYKENDSKNKWGMQPIVAKYYNKLGQSDFTAGFCPNYRVDDTGLSDIKQLGDVNENLLNTALKVLGIINIPSAVQVRSRIVQDSKPLSAPTHHQRGLQLDKKFVFE